jgi:adenylate cyclase
MRATARFVLVGAEVGAVVGLLIHQIEGGPPLPHAARGVASGILIGLLVGIGEEWIFVGRIRWRHYLWVTSVRVGLYTAVIVATLVLVNGVSLALTSDAGPFAAMAIYLTGGTMVRDVVLAALVAVLGTAFLEVRHLHNPGDIRNFLLGRYRFPVEESRVFLFADLVDSTSIAERLGDVTYSRFIGDCYRDVAEAVLAWRGQVYQYVGDKMVISWPLQKGLDDAACLQCFFAMTDLLVSTRARYQEIYGVTPHFRAGLHGGSVVATWVGLAKTELAFHGDSLNVTSRIQGLCKQHGESCVVSATLLDSLTLPGHLRARSLGMAELRGKTEAMEVFAISRAAGDAE